MSKRILFVCTGNLCRSVIAEGLLKKKLSEHGLESVSVSSAGTHALEGGPAAGLAVDVAAERAVDLAGHRSRRLTREMLQEADLVVAMEHEHLAVADALLRDEKAKYRLLSEFGPPHLRGRDIEDPYGAPRDFFLAIYETIEKCVNSLFGYLMEKWELGGPRTRLS